MYIYSEKQLYFCNHNARRYVLDLPYLNVVLNCIAVTLGLNVKRVLSILIPLFDRVEVQSYSNRISQVRLLIFSLKSVIK